MPASSYTLTAQSIPGYDRDCAAKSATMAVAVRAASARESPVESAARWGLVTDAGRGRSLVRLLFSSSSKYPQRRRSEYAYQSLFMRYAAPTTRKS